MNAPTGAPMGHTVYLALGTNLGDRLANLEQARLALEAQVHLRTCSPIYETPPWGYLDQPSFLNQVVKGETDLSPHDLLATLQRLETELGRRPSLRNGPRLIDLDILFYDDLLLETPTLTIPHPRLPGRGFVLVPLADIAPALRHPATGQTVLEMLANCDVRGIQPVSEMSS